MVYLAIKWWIFPWQTGNVITRGYVAMEFTEAQIIQIWGANHPITQGIHTYHWDSPGKMVNYQWELSMGIINILDIH